METCHHSTDGLIYLDDIIVDIDKGDIDDSSFQGYVMDCISQLLDKGLMAEDINVWFSGSGYHLKLKNVFGFQPSKELHTKLKYTMEKHFDFGDSIYDKTRIIRSEWSLNKKTGLSKVFIPLNLMQDLSYNNIKKTNLKKRKSELRIGIADKQDERYLFEAMSVYWYYH